MNNYKELKIWQKSMDLVEKVYAITKTYPKEGTQKMNYALISKFSNL